MFIGEVIEMLISLMEQVPLMSREEKAINEACNFLDKLPRLERATTYEPFKDRVV